MRRSMSAWADVSSKSSAFRRSSTARRQRSAAFEVVDDFVEAYLVGETPNPCVKCNQHIKFTPLLSRARVLVFAGEHEFSLDARLATIGP